MNREKLTELAAQAPYSTEPGRVTGQALELVAAQFEALEARIKALEALFKEQAPAPEAA